MKSSKMGARNAAPALLSGTVPTDHESTYMGDALANVGQREGTTIGRTQLMTPREKGQLERYFRILRKAMP